MSIKKEIRKKGKGKSILGLSLITYFFTLAANAQCAMCRAALQGTENGTKAEAVNDGIVYLMVIPYILVGVIGYIVYRTGKNIKKEKE